MTNLQQDSSTQPGVATETGAAAAQPAEARAAFRPLAGRAFLTHMRHEVLAPVVAAEEIARGLRQQTAERPEKFRDKVIKMHEACQRLIDRLGESLTAERLDLASPNIEATLQTLRHDIGNELNGIGGYCQLLQVSDEKLCFGAFADDLQAMGGCLDLALKKVRRLTTLPTKEPSAELSDALPIADLPAEEAATWLGPDANCPPGVVLVVDDNDVSRTNLTQLLEVFGHTVVLAENGRRALEQLETRDDIDLVLLDINMQDMNGYQVLDQMRREFDWQQIPVVMISAIDSIATIARCIAMGANDYLPKPIDYRMLRARVSSSLAQRRAQLEQKALLSEVKDEKRRREDLLKQLFPFSVVQELLADRQVPSRRYSNVAVMFCDLVGFTSYCDSREPEEVVSKLRLLFEEYENLVEEKGVQKIKTIGDCFMAAGGMLVSRENPVLDCVECAVQMIAAAQRMDWDVRIGIHCGPVVVGLVGRRQYCFDLWGDTVNTSSRVQGEAAPGAIALSAAAWWHVADHCRGEDLGLVSMQGKPPMQLFRFRRFRNPR